MTVIRNLYPRPVVGPEAGVVATYDFDPADLALGRYLDKSGNGYDITRNGTPTIGQGSGTRAVDDVNSYWSRATPIPVTGAASAYVAELEVEANPTATRYLVTNGSVDGFDLRLGNTGILSATFDRATLSSTAAGFCNGKGPMRVAGLFDGVNQHLVINGRLADSDAVVPDAPDGFYSVGQHGTVRKNIIYGAVRSLAQERASYVRDFAKERLFFWKPDVDGTINIATGQSGEEWYCPAGGAGLSFVWMTDLSEPNGGHLALTGDTGTMNRISFDFRRPFFGSVLINYTIRNPAFGADNPRIGFHGIRGGDFTAASSQSYWWEAYNTGGGWWRNQLMRENAGAIGVDADMAVPAANSKQAVLFTRHPSGDFRIYSYCREYGQWFWRLLAVVNDVNFLSTSHISIAPRGSYIESIGYLQGEITPHELEMRL